MPPNKLKSGFGEGVCSVLTALCNISVGNRFRYQSHNLASSKEDGGFGNDDADDDDMGFEGNADVADMEQKGNLSDDDNVDEDFDFQAMGGGGRKDNADDLIQ